MWDLASKGFSRMPRESLSLLYVRPSLCGLRQDADRERERERPKLLFPAAGVRGGPGLATGRPWVLRRCGGGGGVSIAGGGVVVPGTVG